MLKSVRILLVLLLGLMPPFQGIAASQEAARTEKVTVKEGERIRVRILQDISSKTANVGDTFDGEVADEVEVGAKIAIAKGAKVAGTITAVQRAAWLGKPGRLGFTFENARAVDGTRVRLRSTQERVGQGNEAAAWGLGLLIFLPLLLIKGQEMEVKKGTVFTTFVDKDTIVAVPLPAEAEAPPNPAPSLLPTPTATSSPRPEGTSVTLPASAIPHDRLIVPGERIGKWTLAMTLDHVVQLNGSRPTPQRISGPDIAAEEAWAYCWEDLGMCVSTFAAYSQRIEGISIDSPDYGCAKGIRVRSAREDVEKAYGPSTGQALSAIAVLSLVYDEMGIAVALRDGVVTTVRIFRPGTARQFYKF